MIGKKFVLGIICMIIPLLAGCYSTAGQDASDSRAALESFDRTFRPSGKEFTQNFYAATNKCVVDDLNTQGGDFWAENPVLEVVKSFGLYGASQESIDRLLTLIHDAVLNPWTLLDDTSLNGTHGCVTWRTGVLFDLDVIQTVHDLFNGDWWTLTVGVDTEECAEIDGHFKTEISGSRLGVVYLVHVTGTFTLASDPEKEYAIDVVYNLENCFKEWDCVDWEGTIGGYEISDLY